MARSQIKVTYPGARKPWPVAKSRSLPHNIFTMALSQIKVIGVEIHIQIPTIVIRGAHPNLKLRGNQEGVNQDQTQQNPHYQTPLMQQRFVGSDHAACGQIFDQLEGEMQTIKMNIRQFQAMYGRVKS
ncbi:hypothetical protein J1N35_001139 [Gossypium stocksii]|uniref:Uncharacterized protein n=1 Tax=Gossypium stocksii TaxID=47602 RepID=A0A9D3WIT3_9ROSI|nr:hypothetical protein J1N35_001139 [Gossypium stocksii]